MPGLKADLQAYLRTLRAVHHGTDLASAAGNVLGYSEQDLKFKKNMWVSPAGVLGVGLQLGSVQASGLVRAGLRFLRAEQHVRGQVLRFLR